MKRQWDNIAKLIFTLAAFFSLCAPYAAGEDILQSGPPLDDGELDNIHGGFTNSDGNFIHFSMDFVQVNSFLHNGPDASGPANFLNVQQQKAHIGEDEISAEVAIMQSGLVGDSTQTNGNAMSQFPGIQASFSNNSGLFDAILINGNYNSAAITKAVNIVVNIIQVQDVQAAKSMMQNLNLR